MIILFIHTVLQIDNFLIVKGKLTLRAVHKLCNATFGGVDMRSGYMWYVPIISADIPCMYYVHRDAKLYIC